MTPVNVDSAKAQGEREALLAIASEIDDCLICGGHGAVSVLSVDKLEVYGEVERYISDGANINYSQNSS